MGRDGFEQPAGDLVGIGIKKTDPAQVFNSREFFQQKCQAILQAEIFAIAGRVLADQSDLAHARLCQAFRLGNDRLKAPRAELAAQLRNDAESAGMIAPLGNLDVSSMSRSGQHAGRGFVVQIVG